MGATPTIDVHTHYFPPGLPDLARRSGDPRWPSLSTSADAPGRIMCGDTVFRTVTDACWDIDARITAMDETGIDVQVLSPVPVTLTAWADAALAREWCSRHNELLADAVAADPARFRALGAVPLQDPDGAAAEARRIARLGLSGVEIGTEVAGIELDDPDLDPFWAAVAVLDLAVFVHPTDGAGATRRGGVPYEFGLGMLTDTALAATALVFGGVLERFPGLRIGLAHGCGTFAWALPRLANGATIGPRPPTRRQVDERVRQLWVDTLVFDPAHVPLLVERFGRDHLLLGSDFPFYPPAWGDPAGVLYDAAARGLCPVEVVADALTTNGWRFIGEDPDRPREGA